MIRALLAVLFLAPVLALAEAEPTPEEIAAFVAKRKELAESLKPQQGEITLPGGIAKITVPDSMRYYGPEDANTVLVKLWGNPPSEEKPLGMLIPADKSPIAEDAWAVVVDFEESGYVKDDEAAKLDYNKLLKDMKASAKATNEARKEQGYPTVELVGWATKPHYDATAKKIYWAKDLKFEGSPENTLNYFIRILGRRGVLNLNVIGSTSQLAEIEQATPTILSAVDFSEGHRYADFNPASDKIATYGITGLIAGGVLAKTGFFKAIFLGILAFKKFAIIGAVALFALLKSIFSRSKA